MNFFQKIKPEFPLRLSLGFMYIYSGYNLLFHPVSWFWAVPGWFSKIVTQFLALEMYLRIQGALELLMAMVLLAWFVKRSWVTWVALVSSLEFIFILLFAPQFSITFRDIGLLGAALTLLAISLRK